jgi:hypothetical protein
MIRTLALSFACTILAAPALAEDRHYAVEDFDRVSVEGPYVVHLVTGHMTSAVAHGARDALDRISIEVQDQVLRIRRNRSAPGGASATGAGVVTVDLVTRALRGASLSGPVRFDADNIRGPRVEFSLLGAGTLHATRVDADSLSLAMLGSGRLEVAGVARTLAVNVTGSGDLAAPGLIVNNATISSGTSGAVAVTVNGPATVANQGLGNVRIFGRAICTISGTAADQVRCGGPAPSDQRQAH